MEPIELAAKINGRTYGLEISRSEVAQAKAAGLVVVFGYSDDNIEFRGALDDEVGAYNGCTVYVTKDRILPEHERCECPFCGYKEAKKSAVAIEAKWGHLDYSWYIDTEIPHAVFEIFEDGDPFCHGIVFHIDAITADQSNA